jgi:hypothetical protein
LLGFVGFQKSKQLHATESGLFLSSGIPRWMPLELMRETFMTLLKGNWSLGHLLFHKILSLYTCPVSGSLVGVFRWLQIDGFYALGSALQARNICVLTYLWYMCYSKDLISLLSVGTMLIDLTAYQMIRPRWGASQVSASAWNSPPLTQSGGSGLPLEPPASPNISFCIQPMTPPPEWIVFSVFHVRMCNVSVIHGSSSTNIQPNRTVCKTNQSFLATATILL